MPDNPAARAKLASCASVFGRLNYGSLLALVERGEGLPMPVVLFGSEGDVQTLGTSPEEFLSPLAKGTTGSLDLDDNAPVRKIFSAWLKTKKIRIPKAPAFDLIAFLEGGAIAAALAAAPMSGGGFDTLSSDARRLDLVGRRAETLKSSHTRKKFCMRKCRRPSPT